MNAHLSLRVRTALAILSGATFWPLSLLIDDVLTPVGHVVLGGVFGFLVLAAFVETKNYWFARVAGLVVGSILTYALVVELAVDGYGFLGLDSPEVAVIVSGILGALLVGGLTKTLAPLTVAPKFWLYLLVAGVFGGVIFSLLFNSNHAVVIAVGYVAWQVSVFAALYFGRQRVTLDE